MSTLLSELAERRRNSASDYEAWFRQSVAEGRSPDALRFGPMDEGERFRLNAYEGADHTYWQGGAALRLNDGRSQVIERYVMERHLGRQLDRYNEVVDHTCGVKNCIRPAHLKVRPKDRSSLTMTQAEAIARLRAAARRLGRTPLDQEYGSGAPNRATLVKLFGSRKAALEAAGLEAPRPSGFIQQYTDDELLAAVRAKVKELGREPTWREWAGERWTPSASTLSARLGGWHSILERIRRSDQ